MGDGGLVPYDSECFKPPMPLKRQGGRGAGHRCRWRHVLLVMGHRIDGTISVRALASSLSAKTSTVDWGPQREIDHVDRTHLVIILIIFLLGGFSGRFGGYGYGYGHGGVGVIGVILIILLVLVLMGRL